MEILFHLELRGCRVCRASSQAVVVGPPSLVDVVEGVRDPLLLQHAVPLFTEEQGLATAGGTRIEILLWLLLLFLFPVPGSLSMWLLCTVPDEKSHSLTAKIQSELSNP